MSRLFASVLALAVVLPCWADDSVGDAQTIEFLKALQTPGGGFAGKPPTDAAAAPTLRATTSAVRAILALGGKVPNSEATTKFIASCYDSKIGGFADTPGGKVDVPTTAVGVMVVRELGTPIETYAEGTAKYLSDNAKSFEDIRIAAAGFEKLPVKSPKADAWMAEVKKNRNADGTFGKGLGQTRDTASAVVTLLRLGEKVEPRDTLVKALRDGQRGSGGFGKADSENDADLETCYRVMRCFKMLNAQPARVEGLRTYVAKCRNEDGGYSPEPGEPSTAAATYYAVMVRKWLD